MKKILLNLAVALSLLFPVVTVSAANLQDAFSTGEDKPLASMAGKAGYQITESKSLLDYISLGIQTLLSMLGVIFLVLLIYGGYLWMTARGNEQQVEKAKEVIFSSVIGLIIVMGAYAVSYFVIINLSNGVINLGTP